MKISTVSRILILTHLRKKEQPRNLELCTRIWNLSHPVFEPHQPFSQRLSLTEEGSYLPDVPLTSTDERIFSWSGAIDDATPPHRYRYHHAEFIPASDYRFTLPGNKRFVLGGGNLDFCLFRTFESLLRTKIQQGEKLEVIIPLAMVYYSDKVQSPIDYAYQSNKYEAALRQAFTQRAISGFEIYVDEVQQAHGFPVNSQVELHWYTSIKAMFNSPRFFPETSGNSEVINQLINYLAVKRYPAKI